MRIRLQTAIAVLAALFLASCSEQSNKTQASTNAAADAAGPVTGKTALWEIYKTARTWANDLAPLSLESKSPPGAKTDNGKAEVWTATFGSLQRKEARSFTYAVAAHSPDIVKGVSVGHAIPWGGPSRDSLSFDTSDISVDSDVAYATAAKQASAWISKNSGKQATLALGNASRFPAPVWYVLWGDKKNGYAVYVNAKTGAVISK